MARNAIQEERKAVASSIEAKPQVRRQPPYAVIILNDDRHTQRYVVEVLQKVFGYDITKATKLMFRAHNDSRAIVWTGPLEVAELKRNQIQSAGTDFYARKPVRWPLRTEIEPLS